MENKTGKSFKERLRPEVNVESEYKLVRVTFFIIFCLIMTTVFATPRIFLIGPQIKFVFAPLSREHLLLGLRNNVL